MKKVYFYISKAKFLKVKDFIFSLKSPCWQLTFNAQVQKDRNFMSQGLCLQYWTGDIMKASSLRPKWVFFVLNYKGDFVYSTIFL